jgi:hypothetical protein
MLQEVYDFATRCCKGNEEAADDLLRVAGFQLHGLPWDCKNITMRPIRPRDNPTNEIKPTFEDFWNYLAPEERVDVNWRASLFHRHGGVFDVTAHWVTVAEPDLIAFVKRYGLALPPQPPPTPPPAEPPLQTLTPEQIYRLPAKKYLALVKKVDPKEGGERPTHYLDRVMEEYPTKLSRERLLNVLTARKPQ